MQVQPLKDRILLKVLEGENKTEGGLFIPDNAKEKTQKGVVVAAGEHEDVPKDIVGKTVLYDKYAGTSIKIEGQDHLIVRADDLVAVVD